MNPALPPKQTSPLVDLFTKKSLAVGSRIEIRDPSYIWSSAVIVSIANSGRHHHRTTEKNSSTGRKDNKSITVTVRYDGWDVRWNEELPLTSNRLDPIYTHTARLKCLVELFQKRKTNYERQLSKSNLWPCILHVRMPSSNAPIGNIQTAEYELSVEPNVFVEPYRPDLLPIYIQKDWQNGGLWVSATRIRVFSEKMMQPLDSHNYSDSTFYPQGFQLALMKAKQDLSVPGYHKNDIFLKGSLVKDEYRVMLMPTRTDQNESDVNINVKNPLVDLSHWKNELVSLEGLDSILQSHLGDDQVPQPRQKRKSVESLSSQENEHNDEPLHGENRKMSKLGSPSSINNDVQKTPKGSSLQSSNLDPYLDGHVVHNHDSNNPAVTKRPPHKKGHFSRFPNAIKVTNSIYPGYDISPSSCVPGNWIASVMIRGSKVQIGQYKSQTEAKHEIEKYYQNSNEFNGCDDSNTFRDDDVMDSSDDELDVLILTKKKTAERHVLNYKSNIQTPPVNINQKELDIHAISIEDAVSYAYRHGHIEDTGFSFHGWAKAMMKGVKKPK